MSHLHINASPDPYTGGKAFPRLHLPTRRVRIEDVIRHLLDEHHVPAISPSWRDVLNATLDAFEEIQKRRLIAD